MVGRLIHRYVALYRKNHDIREVVICAVVWAFIFISLPAARLLDYWRDPSASAIDWSGLGSEYLSLIPFIILFVFNDLVLAPVIVRLRRIALYALLAMASALLMTFVIENFRSPEGRAPLGGVREGGVGGPGDVPPPKPLGRDGFLADSLAAFPGASPTRPPYPDGGHPMGAAPAFHGDFVGQDGKTAGLPRPQRINESQPPAPGVIGSLRLGPMMIDFILALMMMCAGTLIKLYLISDRDKARLRLLAKARTDAELEQLRYQVSPHFMMNTLNNIHALVDVDAERAKDAIVRMSRLMRHMLYEGGKPLVSLDSEVTFLRDYVELMRLRFTDAVSVTLDAPETVGDVMLPPLLFVNLVENAFKHGVSYSKPSFVDVRLSLSDDRREVSFCCVNSLSAASTDDERHGIGVQNTRKRLELLCRGRFNLSAVRLADRYVVTLSIQIA